MFTRGIVDTRATKSTELTSSAESVCVIGGVEDDASRTSGKERGSCECGEQPQK